MSTANASLLIRHPTLLLQLSYNERSQPDPETSVSSRSSTQVSANSTTGSAVKIFTYYRQHDCDALPRRTPTRVFPHGRLRGRYEAHHWLLLRLDYGDDVQRNRTADRHSVRRQDVACRSCENWIQAQAASLWTVGAGWRGGR